MGLYDQFLVEWNSSYSVGVPAIDRQHRFLVEKIRLLQEAMAAGSAGAVLAPLIHSLVTYTRYHFAYEEGVLEKRGYGDLKQHKKFHAEMTLRVTEMEEAIKNNQLRTGAPVMQFLSHWLIDHILGDDAVAFEAAVKRPVAVDPGDAPSPVEG